MMGVSIAINTNHDSSLSVVEDGKLVVHLIEERYRHLKHCAPPCHVLKELEKYVDHIDAICFTDIHYGLKQNSRLHLEDCHRYVDWFIAEAKARNAETCIFLGRKLYLYLACPGQALL